VTFIYTAPDDLAVWSGRTLTEIELTVQARHDPGVDPGQLGELGPSMPRLDQRLERWLK
jgi:inner membrane protein